MRASNEQRMEEISPFRHIKYNVIGSLQDKTPLELKLISVKLALPIHLMLFNLDGNMNIAMSIRTAAVMGCSDVWIIGRKSYDARPEVGSKNYINVHKLATLDDPVAFFKTIGLEPVLVEQGGQALEDVSFGRIQRSGRPVCFIMGSESHGIEPAMLDKMAGFPKVTISQYGIVRSLNVSVAASIVIYEYVRQLRKARKEI